MGIVLLLSVETLGLSWFEGFFFSNFCVEVPDNYLGLGRELVSTRLIRIKNLLQKNFFYSNTSLFRKLNVSGVSMIELASVQNIFHVYIFFNLLI